MSACPPDRSEPGRHFATGDRVSVLLPVPPGKRWDYRVPDGIAPAVGDIVRVPFGGRQVIGVVWGAAGDDVDETRLRDILERFDSPALPDVTRAFIEWVAAYTVQPPGAVLRMTISVPAALSPSPPARALALADSAPDIVWTAARTKVRDLLLGGPPRPAAALARAADVGTAVVAGLLRAGALRVVDLPPAPPERPDPHQRGPVLTAAQTAAAAKLRAGVEAGFTVTLLDGVAGSGKTEVYFEAVAAALAAGRQVLVLLPEIALGAQWLGRFKRRFGAAPAQWHSEMTAAARRGTWRAVAEGTAGVVVGARSALMLPYPNLGLIVVDEEHDGAFKQEDGVTYNARDMAVVRGRLGGIPVVLVSATPSLETVINVQAGRYQTVHLPDRHFGAPPPRVDVVDLRADRPPRGSWLSPPLRAAIGTALADGGQAMLFLNRRGWAPLTICRACGHRLRCPDCTAWLVEHRLIGRLQCHHCGLSMAIPDACPACGAEGELVGCGPGVERVAEDVAGVFPDARLALATSDTLTGPRAAEDLVRRMEGHDIDIVIGTQIVAKGYHFPLLVLVGIVDADLGLAGGDLRASERTWQLLHQVAGRAGRAERPGRVILQTHMPEHPVIQSLAAHDRDGFLAAETASRRAAGMPPFGRLAALIVSGRDAAVVEAVARSLARAAPSGAGVRVLGPAPAPLALLRGRHRWRLLLIAGRDIQVSRLVATWIDAIDLPNAVRVQVDIDPYSFL